VTKRRGACRHPSGKEKLMKRRHKKKIPLVSYLFIFPALILNLMFFVFPFLQSLLMSFYDWPVMGGRPLSFWIII
jgi:ABC-type sugar transport systems, permease components